MEDFNSKYTGEEVEELLNQIANKEHTTVGFANDLTGVIEATPEEFTYRPSAGNKSIRDASAVIRRIKGNTVVFAQLSALRDDLHREGDWSITPEVTTNTWGGFSKAVQVIAGHQYLFYINKKDGRSITDTYTLLKDTHRVEFNTPLFITSTETASWGWTALYKTSTNGLRFQTQAFDLTRLFDAGNEPTTIEEFKSKFPDSYYPYSEPEVRNVITNQITTIGFNQWDEQWELGTLTDFGVIAHNSAIISRNFNKILPSTKYYGAYLSDAGSIGNILQIGFWDKNMVYIGRQYATNKAFTTPANAAYFKVATNTSANITTYNNDICINLSHSGVRNGKYEPYKRNTRTLPEIYKYFPDGMNGNANVWDEINTEKAIKRWGVVDLGSLTWNKGGTGTSGVYRWLGKGIEHLAVKTVTASDIPNIVCAKYISSSASNIWSTSMPMQVSLDPTGSVLIYDSGYNADSTTIADFTAHLQGVLLYYELAEPIETPITEAIQLDYVVDDFGTERAISLGNSAPFRADIVYQFNAEGRIRDNSRNIERIENTITDRLIPSQTAMLGLPNKVMTWNGSSAMMSLPIANSFAEWEMEEYPYEAIPTGKQVMDYISAIKGSLATGLIPKETLTIDASGPYLIFPNKAYEVKTASNTNYNVGLHIVTTDGIDAAADNEWRIRIDARTGFGADINIKPFESGYTIRWAYPEDEKLGAGTAPTIKADFIWDIQFRMIGKTLLGSYKKYR